MICYHPTQSDFNYESGTKKCPVVVVECFRHVTAGCKMGTCSVVVVVVLLWAAVAQSYPRVSVRLKLLQ